ncbi:MAG: tyrosine-type recombinase/integrase [Rhodoplanes sp.]
MPRPRPPHVHLQITRHGKRVWYFRAGHGPRIRLPAGPGEPGFDDAYQAALAGRIPDPIQHTGPKRNTFAWAIERYRETAEWREYDEATRKLRDRVFCGIIDKAGDRPLSSFITAVIEAGVAKRKPGAAWGYLGALRPFFRWCVKARLVSTDPTAGVRRPALRKGGWAPWTDDEMAAFERAYPVGTRERVAYDIARFTGLRRSDIVRLGRPHIRDGVIRITTKKGGVRVTQKMHPTLAAHLAATQTGDLTFVVGPDGAPMRENAFSKFFQRACRRIGIKKSVHGIRKSAAENAAENGATDSELMAAFGWRDHRMPAHYTLEADRERLGLAASERLIVNDDRTSIPSPSHKGEGRKAKRH